MRRFWLSSSDGTGIKHSCYSLIFHDKPNLLSVDNKHSPIAISRPSCCRVQIWMVSVASPALLSPSWQLLPLGSVPERWTYCMCEVEIISIFYTDCASGLGSNWFVPQVLFLLNGHFCFRLMEDNSTYEPEAAHCLQRVEFCGSEDYTFGPWKTTRIKGRDS